MLLTVISVRKIKVEVCDSCMFLVFLHDISNYPEYVVVVTVLADLSTNSVYGSDFEKNALEVA